MTGTHTPAITGAVKETKAKRGGKLFDGGHMDVPPRLSRPFHSVKMLAAVCPDRDTAVSHQPKVATTGYWIEACEAAGHDPFARKVREKRTREKLDLDASTGEEIITSTEEYYVQRTIPNLEQVPWDIKSSSNKALEYALEMGWVYPQEKGFAPYCDFYNCWVQNPRFVTNVGTYCTREQAAVMVLVTGNSQRSDKGISTYLTFGEDAENFQRQLSQVGAVREDG